MRVNKKSISTTVRGMTELEKEFALKFYRWALEDARREYSEGFPLLERIKSKMVSSYLEFVSALSPDEKRVLEVAMVKRFHEEGTFLAGDHQTQRENAMVERYLKRNIRKDPQFGPVSVLSQAEKKWAQDLASGSNKYQLDRKKLRATLKDRLTPVLGDSVKSFGSEVGWRHATPIGRWVVHTWVDTGGRVFQLSYFHTVTLPQQFELTQHVSILRWLGIAGQTSWDLLANADIPAAADSVAEMSFHFITRVSKILSDL